MKTIGKWANDPRGTQKWIKLKIGRKTKFGTINLNIRVLKLENNLKMGY